MMATSPMESLSSGFIINIELFFITLLLALPTWISDYILLYVKV